MKRLRTTIPILVTLVFMVWLNACKHEVPQPAIPVNPGPGTEPVDTGRPCNADTVYFERDVLPILISNCVMSGCHDPGTAEDGVVLNSYSNVMKTADVRPFNLRGSDLYEVITDDDEDKRMPQYPRTLLTQQQINTIAKWINQGAQNIRCEEITCDTTNVTFSGTIRPLLQQNCLGCHSGSAPSGNLDFNQFNTVKTVAQNGRLYGAVTHSQGFKAMPQGGNKLSACNIAKIKKWIDGGARNN